MLGSSEANQRRHWTAEFLCCSISCKLCTCTAYMLKWISSSPDASFPPWPSSQRPFSVSLHLIEHLAGSVARGGRAAGVVRHWVFKVLNNVHGHPMLLFLSDHGHRRAGCILRPSCHRRVVATTAPPLRPSRRAGPRPRLTPWPSCCSGLLACCTRPSAGLGVGHAHAAPSELAGARVLPEVARSFNPSASTCT